MNNERLYQEIIAGEDPEAPVGLDFFNFIDWTCRYLDRRFTRTRPLEKVRKRAGKIIGTLLGWIVEHVPQGEMLHSSRKLGQTNAWIAGTSHASKMPEVGRWLHKVGYLALGGSTQEYFPTTIKELDARNPFVLSTPTQPFAPQ